MKTLLLLAGLTSALFSQSFPTVVVTDLPKARNRLQTTLSASMTATQTSMTVASAVGIVANTQLTIGTEIVWVCSVSSLTLQLGKSSCPNIDGRGYDVANGGAAAAVHTSGSTVSGFVTAAHIRKLNEEVVAIETALGPNLSNLTSTGFLTVTAYDFSAQTCNSSNVCSAGGASGGSLIAGNTQITMTPVPSGVNGSDVSHSLYVSGGTGTAEACPITGGTGTSGDASGAIIINCAHTHTGAFTIGSASAGMQEAHNTLPSIGGCIYVPAGTHLITGLSITKSVRFVGAGDSTIVKLVNSTNPAGAVISAVTPGISVSFGYIRFDGNRANNSTTGPAFIYGNGLATQVSVDHCSFINGNFNSVVLYEEIANSSVTNSYFLNNVVHSARFLQAAATETRHQFTGNDVVYSSYSISGCTNGTPIVCATTVAHGFITGQGVTITGSNVAYINNEWGAITVVTPNTFSLDGSTAAGAGSGATVWEGNFALAAVNQGGIVVSNNRLKGGGEGLQIYGTSDSVISSNTIISPRDAGITVFGDGSTGTANGNSITANVIISACFEGLYCGDKCINNTFSGNSVQGSGTCGISARKSGMQIFGSSSAANILTGNILTGNLEYGINVRASVAATRIIGNYLAGNTSGEFTTDGTDTGTEYQSSQGTGSIYYTCTGIATSSATLHLSAVPPGACTATTEALSFVLNGRRTLLRNLMVRFGSVAVNNTVVTVRLNGATSTALTCTVLAGASTCNDVTHSVIAVSNDVIAVRVVTGATETLSGIQVSLDN
jgi:parallel beta-helix repeat protein